MVEGWIALMLCGSVRGNRMSCDALDHARTSAGTRVASGEGRVAGSVGRMANMLLQLASSRTYARCTAAEHEDWPVVELVFRCFSSRRKR